MMKIRIEESPALVVEYTDPEEGFGGWLVIDSLEHELCAGGMRVQPGLTRERLAGSTVDALSVGPERVGS